jgi:uroporphyrinogen III methyltransferase/synthase
MDEEVHPSMPTGKIYLVGAGPGDPELLTLKGLRVLQEADVVVYDRLANPRLLEHARPEAERVYVGKETRNPAVGQAEINALLVAKGREGKVVCRLKGGDPFVFGRGGEEAEALTAAGLPWEYVPGVTSPIAVPGYAGIPVTHRGICSTFAVITAHEDPAKGEPTIRWGELARGADTLIFLMGVQRLPLIVAELTRHGLPAQTPAAVVSWGTYPRQTAVEGTLADIRERCEAARLPAPAVVVVGEVARLRERLRWYDRRPLFGKRIAVTRPREQSEGLERLIEAAGGEAVVTPLIRTRRLPDPDLSGLEMGYDWVVFTSANGVYSLAVALQEAGKDLRWLGRARIAAIGPETARAARGAGIRVDFVPEKSVAEQVVAEFPEPVQGKRVLVPRAREAREVLPERWRAAGAVVDVLPVYETEPDEEGAARLRGALEAGELEAITFTSGSAVQSFARQLSDLNFTDITLACLGPVTARALRELGLRADVEAENATSAGLVDALEMYYARSENRVR